MTSMATGSAAQNPYGIVLFSVRSAAGSDLHLMTTEEAQWYERNRDRYLKDNHFPNASDLQDLDRLLLLEVMVYRWGLWMGQGFDYFSTRIDESQLRTYIKEYSAETRLIKASLGIDKSTRDRDKGESLADYTENLLARAKEFGYHRNAQYEQAVTRIYELRSMLLTYDRCDDEERKLLDLSPESILAWVRESVVHDWDELSAAFRRNQAVWVKDM